MYYGSICRLGLGAPPSTSNVLVPRRVSYSCPECRTQTGSARTSVREFRGVCARGRVSPCLNLAGFSIVPRGVSLSSAQFFIPLEPGESDETGIRFVKWLPKKYIPQCHGGRAQEAPFNVDFGKASGTEPACFPHPAPAHSEACA